ncbi:Biopolymer transport protein ExbD/TolR [Nostoc sp. NIES-3756]|uniref:ExbD/TolR family protein n=1 Tax=Nostoc sp. NIES-3756 TaxID=1751286 RepID=UPI00071F22A9|nr:biopolymer transporter ExbD [Nostoc sp. NIES-3756]BAT53109.1 Biopolymer transport protein ExbD/TolR [Nostoc sp. NIES-3756]BAY39167.1 biopolymer transport protein ExbD/TolR [Nostoc sp. NIES-2111]
MKVNLHTPVEEVQIQIIPLIDVVFCILTFFLLAALQFTRQQAINVDLPKASNSTAASINSAGGNLIVTIDAVGNTYVEKQQVTRDSLVLALKQYVQANPNGVLVLNASRTATYNDVIETLDLLRQVGGDRVSLGIIPTSAQLQPSIPNFPINPGIAPIPNTEAVPGINPPPSDLNPNLPTDPNQPPTGQGNPLNPGVPPVVPQVPVAPGSISPAPQR